MLFSKSVEYALRAVAWLAAHAESSGDRSHPTPAPATQIAAATEIPGRFLSDILQALARAGVVDSQRGPKGGFILSKPADHIYVLDIVSVIDPIRRMDACPLTGAERHEELCPLHRMLDDALAQIETVFAHTKLSDLACLGVDIGLPAAQEPSRDGDVPRESGGARSARDRRGGRSR